jgi:adenosylcobinamide-GDP ribazoletransferase
MPFTEWNSGNLKYALCFLPLAGIVVGAAETLWYFLSFIMGISAVLSAAFACIIPMLVTGGIHMDGFSDVTDAKSSHADRERKLEIMNDSHTGAFGVMWSTAYILMLFAVFYELYGIQSRHMPLVYTIVFVTSRGLTSLAIASISLARKEGMLFTFYEAADRRTLMVVSIAVLAVCEAGFIYVFGYAAVIYIAVAAVMYFLFRRMAMKEFGGISGDLCGWLIQMTELVLLFVTIFVLRSSLWY